MCSTCGRIYDSPTDAEKCCGHVYCEACQIEAKIGTEDVPHPVDARLHTCTTSARTHRRDLTIREIQTRLPWTVHYHRDFRASPMTHKDFGHALLHVSKAVGKIAAVVNDAEHGGSDFKPEEIDNYVADLVVCALRMANTCPGHVIDLQDKVIERIETKNQQSIRGEKQ